MDDAREALVARLGVKPLHRIVGGGYTLMEHWLVELEDGTRAFAKVAVDEPTAGFLRDEHCVYSQVEARFLPAFRGWDDDGERPILLLEDLTGAHWPPPWRDGDVAAVFEALEELHETSPPPGLPSLTLDEFHTWREVEESPEPFLSLGLCSPSWLDTALPELLAATERCVIAGDAFLHLDTRSDNICFRDGRALLVDWNWAHTGNPAVDVAFWLPSAGSVRRRRPDGARQRLLRSDCRPAAAGGCPDRPSAPARAAEGCAALGRGRPRATASRPVIAARRRTRR